MNMDDIIKQLDCVTMGVSNRLSDGQYIYFYETDGTKNCTKEISEIINGSISAFSTKHGFHYVNFRVRAETEYRALYELTKKRFGGYYDRPDEHKHFVLRLSPKFNLNGGSDSVSPRYVNTVFNVSEVTDRKPFVLSGQHLVLYEKVCGMEHEVTKLLRICGVVINLPLTFTVYRTRD